MKKALFILTMSLSVLATVPLMAMNIEDELFSNPSKNYKISITQIQKWVRNSSSSNSWNFWYLWETPRKTYLGELSTAGGTFTICAYAYSDHLPQSLKPDTEVIFAPLHNMKKAKMFCTLRSAFDTDERTSAEFIFLVYPKGSITDEEG